MRRVGELDWAAVVVNYNAGVFLDGCLRSLYGSDVPPSDVVVVDNASSDDSVLELAAWPRVVVEACRENLGFAGGANRGIARTDAPIVVVLNPDVNVDPGFGAALVELFAANPRLGVAGPKLRYPDGGLIQHAGGIVSYPLLTTAHRGYREPDDGRWDQPLAVDFVTGGAMALRRAALDAAGLFDEGFYPAYYEDVDLCFRLRRAGWQVRYEPSLTATHFESVTLGRSLDYYRLFHRNRLRFALKHLSRAAWWTQFLPAETQRLRGELSAVSDADWPVTSGAAALEALVRARGFPRASRDAGLLDGEPLLSAVQAIDELRERRLLTPAPDSPGSLGARLRGWARRLSARAAVRDLTWRQQAFNDAVVRAFEAQDRLNREHVVDLLLVLLDLVQPPAARKPPAPDSQPRR